MKGRFPVFLFVFLFFITWSASAALGLDLKEGLWQINVDMKIPGMPMQMPTQVQTHCITKDNPAPQKGPIQGCEGCKIIDNKIRGNTVSWVVECDHPDGKIRGEGRIVYSGTTFAGKVKITQGDMVMWQELSGERGGPCEE